MGGKIAQTREIKNQKKKNLWRNVFGPWTREFCCNHTTDPSSWDRKKRKFFFRYDSLSAALSSDGRENENWNYEIHTQIDGWVARVTFAIDKFFHTCSAGLAVSFKFGLLAIPSRNRTDNG